MAHEATHHDLLDPQRAGEVPESLFLFGLAMPFGFLTFNAAVIGLFGLLTGRLAPIPALALLLAGGVATWLIARRVLRSRS